MSLGLNLAAHDSTAGPQPLIDPQSTLPLSAWFPPLPPMLIAEGSFANPFTDAAFFPTGHIAEPFASQPAARRQHEERRPTGYVAGGLTLQDLRNVRLIRGGV